MSALSIKDELLALEARKAELQTRLDAPEMPELLHTRMADVYRNGQLDAQGVHSYDRKRTGR